LTKIIKRLLPDGAWQLLLPHALKILNDIKEHGTSLQNAQIILNMTIGYGKS